MRRALLWCLVGSVFTCSTADAAIIIDIGSTTLTPGGSGSIDVRISSDASDQLGLFSFEFKIVRETGAGQLDFTNPQSNAQLSDSSYVFNIGTPNSYDALSNGDVVGNVTPSDVFTGGDLTNDFTNMTIPQSASSLVFAHLDFASDPTMNTQAGDVFRIDLVDGPDTAFYDAAYFDDPFNTPPISYNSTSGHVTIAGTNAVPEPGTFGMTLTGAIGLLWRKRIRRGA